MKNLQVSPKDPHYFADADGRTFIPIGCNLCFFRDDANRPEQEVLDTYRSWMTAFAENGGNFMRIWLGVPFFEVMPEKLGVFDEKATSHIRYIVELAEKLNIKIKFTLDHFRRTIPTEQDVERFPGAVNFVKPVYAPLAKNMKEYLNSPECRKLYLDRARFLSSKGFGDSKAVVAWELWNEIDCIGDVYREVGSWSDYMLVELQKIFPNQVIVQNLGSFSGPLDYLRYDYLGKLKNNAFIQVHRYLDPGASIDVCRGPMDLICADAIRELLVRTDKLPAILAECGAVESGHSRYSDLYAIDDEGTLLHDVIFGAFFAGSAGCGQPWHWDHIYIAKKNLWYHFKRFQKAVEGIDPAEEHFRPYHMETRRLRIYGLVGKKTDLFWCRDKASDWDSELKKGIPAAVISGEKIPLQFDGKCTCYLPWEDRTERSNIKTLVCELPDFRRSLVVRVSKT